jgi:hypothetical protein
VDANKLLDMVWGVSSVDRPEDAVFRAV